VAILVVIGVYFWKKRKERRNAKPKFSIELIPNRRTLDIPNNRNTIGSTEIETEEPEEPAPKKRSGFAPPSLL
jgi:hypothetical protein